MSSNLCSMSSHQFIAAKYFKAVNRKTVDYIVVHTMEIPCKVGMAMRCAIGFQKDMDPNRVKSAHYCVDPENIIQCVHEYDLAWHCPKGNTRGIGIEIAAYGVGNATTPATDWTSDVGQAALKNAAIVCAEACKRWDIPVVKLSVDDLVEGTARGIAGHVDFSNAFKTPGGHQDPGVFVWDQFIALVEAAS